MPIAAVIGLVLGNLPALIQVIEMLFAFKGQGAGAIKKEAVLGVTASVVDTIAALPGNAETGRQKEQILDLAGKATDAIVASINAVKGWQNPVVVGSDR